MTALYWREPAWLLLGLLPLLWLAWQRLNAGRLRRRYADPDLWPWALDTRRPAGSHWRRAVMVLAWLLLGLAAAGPRTPVSPTPTATGGELMVVLDLSRSMAAADVWPSRRGLALRALAELLPRLTASRVGLVVVAGRAHRLWPLSPDRQGLVHLLTRLDRLQMPSHGSQLAEGIRLAATALDGDSGQRQILLLSDADLTIDGFGRLSQALRDKAAIPTLIAGVGTPGGAALPGPDGDWLRQDGNPVLSRLDEARLQDLARITRAQYLRLPETAPGQALQDALPDALSRPALDADAPVVWHELFPWLLLPALLLGLIGVLRLPPRVAPAGLAATLLYLVTLGLTLPVRADLQQAHRALAADDAGRARQLYDQLPGYAARMGSGTACHRLQDWACARQAFSRAVLLAPDDEARATAIYNLAHSRFQTGDYGAAADLFEDALNYAPGLDAARHNRDFARALATEVARLAGGPQADRQGRGRASTDSTRTPAPDQPRSLTDGPRTAPARTGPATAAEQALINRGLAFTRLSATGQDDMARPWAHVLDTDAPTQAADISLWQGLLERAEGLPAPPESPLTLPEVRPW